MSNRFSPMALFFFLLLLPHSLSVASAAAGENPFTPKGYLLRFWNNKISNNQPTPSFLLSKASPLNAVDAAAFAKLAGRNGLSSHLPAFCVAAELLCLADLSPSLDKHDHDSNFAVYSTRNFTNYGGSGRVGGSDSFKNYSDGENFPIDSFRRYSRNSASHLDRFAGYGSDGNVADHSFNTYGAGAAGGRGEFINYHDEVNVPNLKFNNYAADGSKRAHSFTSYIDSTNSGGETFVSYGKNGNEAPNDFTSYAKEANVAGSGFISYGEGAKGANDTFTNYGIDGNVPENKFTSYGAGGNGGADTFANYREDSNVGDDVFTSYGKNSNSGGANFVNYGKSFNLGTDKFTGYGQGARGQGHAADFKIYGVNTTFKEYGKNGAGVTFASYSNDTVASVLTLRDNKVNRWVEPGKFFRESMLKKGTIMPMPDIRDKMPKRSFLPQTISSKLPFSTSKLSELKAIFHAADNSSMESMIRDALSECERAPSQGENKRCVGSIEDMIDFASSVLGRNIVVRTTDNVNGSNQKVLIGTVKGINGGKVTESVSCHQSLYPYLLYYCHSVPKVRVYEADILDLNSKTKINHGIAVCHLDTSAWSATHGAFLALGSSPGQIEVCHWIFENDMTWARAD